jgi:hypothetical protein
MARTNPILVTGAHKAGTTWVGHMLCASGEAGYIHEPFNIDHVPGWGAARFPYWWQYICHENEAPFIDPVRDILSFRYPLRSQLRYARRPRSAARLVRDWTRSLADRGRRALPLMKDPIAFFSTEWLAERFEVTPVVMIRHPAAFVGSIVRYGHAFDFREWTRQPLLMRDALAPFATQVHGYADSPPDLIDQAVLMWNAIYGVAKRYRHDHPGWAFVRHEDLSLRPEDGFRSLYLALGLDWNERAESRIRDHSTSEGSRLHIPWREPADVKRSSRSQVRTWQRRLSAEEIDRVHAGVEEIASSFYAEEDWAVDEAAVD